MRITSIKYLVSAPRQKFWPKDDKKEICIIGKSNVGKSTFINKLSNNSKASKVSSKPGFTRYLNFFDVNNSKFRIIDTPGYGYAKISLREDEKFLKMMEEYIKERDNTVLFILLIDIRRSLTDDDLLLMDLLDHINKPFIVVGTKKDKTNQSQRHKFKNDIKNYTNISKIVHVSKNETSGFNEILKEIEKYI